MQSHPCLKEIWIVRLKLPNNLESIKYINVSIGCHTMFHEFLCFLFTPKTKNAYSQKKKVSIKEYKSMVVQTFYLQVVKKDW